jgi:hypothetical protein
LFFHPFTASNPQEAQTISGFDCQNERPIKAKIHQATNSFGIESRVASSIESRYRLERSCCSRVVELGELICSRKPLDLSQHVVLQREGNSQIIFAIAESSIVCSDG